MSIQWPELLGCVPDNEAQAVGRLGPDTCGLAIEHLLQMNYRPVMMARRRSGAGAWSERRIEKSRSRGAVNSTKFPGMFNAVRVVWDHLARTPWPADGQSVSYHSAGRAVFPGRLR